VAGTSIATSGVVFISADATPTGTMSRRIACAAVVTVASSRQVTRAMMPVLTTPFATTSMPATVITPPLLSPANSADTGASWRIPPTARPVASARTAGTFPEAMAASVATTTTAARISMIEGYTESGHGCLASVTITVADRPPLV
jgi:hypothetical protein